jgi:ABC-type histidine transport system ATPase subunit
MPLWNASKYFHLTLLYTSPHVDRQYSQRALHLYDLFNFYSLFNHAARSAVKKLEEVVVACKQLLSQYSNEGIERNNSSVRKVGIEAKTSIWYVMDSSQNQCLLTFPI